MRSLLAALAFALGACGSTPATPSDGAAGEAGTTIPACEPTPTMSAATFCAIFVPSCGTSHAGFTSVAECTSSYEAKTAQQACLSRHICTALDYPPGTADRDAHCGHATGAPGTVECE